MSILTHSAPMYQYRKKPTKRGILQSFDICYNDHYVDVILILGCVKEHC